MTLELLAEAYAETLEKVREVARVYGYAVAVHGSGRRDLDLIAVPWVEDAAEAAVLIEGIRQAVGGVIHERVHDAKQDRLVEIPYRLPHGRLGWSIHLPGTPSLVALNPYIDISVTALAATEPTTDQETRS